MRVYLRRSIVAFAILFLIGPLAACKRDEWTVFVYPDAENIPNANVVQNYTIGNVASLEECKKVASDRMRFMFDTNNTYPDYQCGLNCDYSKELGNMYICEEVSK